MKTLARDEIDAGLPLFKSAPTVQKRRPAKRIAVKDFPALAAEFAERYRDDPDACWPWPGYIDTAGSIGYGRMGGGGKRKYAHRVSREYHHGPMPDGHQTRHTCDNPACWNPRHLISGTPLQNVRDMIERGRSRRPLRKADVICIDLMLKDGIAIDTIAASFDISKKAIRRILWGVTWSKVTGRTCTWPSRRGGNDTETT